MSDVHVGVPWPLPAWDKAPGLGVTRGSVNLRCVADLGEYQDGQLTWV